ncbi:DUF167 domain-containing protein [Candidatus Sarmatiella mevalonica]|uniref:DUF167 domain-containing protein n=1 Tax=Candidatus Sarmatiella mevalonica TaxID=2770581 RepID=UPI0019227371|nr:DUF167 domain-containing protein [Candidatus Sarmatiella mevalonica]
MPTILQSFLHVRLKPKSSRNKIIGFDCFNNQRYLIINIAAQPIDNAANETLVSFLSQILRTPKARIHILRGAHSKFKKIKIDGISQEQLDRMIDVILY